MNITKELLEKAKTAKSAEELLQMAKAENIELTAEQAAKAFAELKRSGELSDEELDNVAGGGCGDSETTGKRKFNVGDRVLVNKHYPGIVLSYSTTCYAGRNYYMYDVRYDKPYNGSDGGTFKEEQLIREKFFRKILRTAV